MAKKTKSKKLKKRLKERNPDKTIIPDQEKSGSRVGRPPKEHRAKYTTALRPILKKLLKLEAMRQDITPADMLNRILQERYADHELNAARKFL